jgi:hypothetical protein
MQFAGVGIKSVCAHACACLRAPGGQVCHDVSDLLRCSFICNYMPLQTALQMLGRAMVCGNMCLHVF